MYEAGRWPIGIYPPWLRAILTFVVPVGFAITVPAEGLVGRLDVVDPARRRRPGRRPAAGRPLVLADRAAALLGGVGLSWANSTGDWTFAIKPAPSSASGDVPRRYRSARRRLPSDRTTRPHAGGRSVGSMSARRRGIRPAGTPRLGCRRDPGAEFAARRRRARSRCGNRLRPPSVARR